MAFLPDWPLHISPLMAFGLVLIVGALGGFIAHRVSWLPSITGFLLVGFACGPSGIGLMSNEVIADSQILLDIALALILYRLGLSLDIKLVQKTRGLLLTALVESGATFGLVFLVLYLMAIPTTIAMLIAAIAISSSPAVLLHVGHEVGASGEVTESTKTLVALNNLISFVAFTAALPALLYSTGSHWTTILLFPLYGLAGSLLIGAVFAYGLHLLSVKTKEASQYQLALVIGTIMIAIGLAYELKVSMLFAPLVIGIVVKSLEKQSLTSSLEFGAPFELFYIVLFVFAGAGLHIHELIAFAPVVLVLVLARTIGKLVGTTATLTAFKKPLYSGFASGMLLVPMAGLAIGLVQTATHIFPKDASMISAIVLGAVAIFETIGPPVAVFAFRLAGETRTDVESKCVGIEPAHGLEADLTEC